MGRVRAVAVRVVIIALAASAAAWALFTFGAVYVGGDSMCPTLMRGDLVVLRRGPARVTTGDVVLAEKPGWPAGVLHRVIAVDFDDRLRLKGDANVTPDLDPTARTAVRGVVVLVVPSGRVLAVFDSLARMVQSRLT
jgi:signal peptidase I